jgi:hypothetical protein
MIQPQRSYKEFIMEIRRRENVEIFTEEDLAKRPPLTPEQREEAKKAFVYWLERPINPDGSLVPDAGCRDLTEAEEKLVYAERERTGEILGPDEIEALLGPVDPPFRLPGPSEPSSNLAEP